MLCIYAAVSLVVWWELRLILFFGSRIVPIAIFSLTNAIKFNTTVCFSYVIIALGVISIIGDNMEHASCLLLESICHCQCDNSQTGIRIMLLCKSDLQDLIRGQGRVKV
jgi:hypothetical protein